ncbi:RYamide receptor isoform X2 [Cherax quadricarinatus]|uniref:RYamide receptor isoform X2 n=1 Tax=Cherax quadricarinatus TaxID=27406 RepID=UPI002379EEAE|nr:RYamide receptor-like isoform X2 [Cherax quadricarinatus]
MTVNSSGHIELNQGGATSAVLTPSVEDILERCNEEFLSLWYWDNKSSLWENESFSLQEYSHCQYCNITEEELDILIYSGICMPSQYPYIALIYKMYAAIFLLALVGNSLVLYTVAANRKMHTVTNLFIANLAVGDLLIMVLCVPFSVASIIVLQYWPFGEVFCVFVNYSQAVSIFVSAYTLVAISLDRYRAIIYPLRPRMSRLQAKVIIGLVWGLALFTTLPIAVFSSLDPIGTCPVSRDALKIVVRGTHSISAPSLRTHGEMLSGPIAFEVSRSLKSFFTSSSVVYIRIFQSSGREVCMEQWPDENLRVYYTVALMILQYFLPLVVLIFTYSRIACKVWGCKPVTSPCSRSAAAQMQPLAPSGKSRSFLRKSTSDHPPAKVVLDLVEEVRYWPHFHHLWFVFHWLAMSHACYNPLILCWMNARFREGYLHVLYNLMPCCRERLSRSLLKLRQSSGLHRAHTYSTAFGSSHNSRNQRFLEDSRKRRDSSGSTKGSMQMTSTKDGSFKLLANINHQPSTNGFRRKAGEREHSDTHIRENDTSLQPSLANTCVGTGGQLQASGLDLPHEMIDRYLFVSGESTL